MAVGILNGHVIKRAVDFKNDFGILRCHGLSYCSVQDKLATNGRYNKRKITK